MVRWVKSLAAKSDRLSLIPGPHMEGETQHPQFNTINSKVKIHLIPLLASVSQASTHKLFTE